MNIVFIVPTGIGAEIGGHAGDATPAVRMLAPICDRIIVHPNVVNASDINEMPENALYVEGYALDNFLRGSINLKETKGNVVAVAVNAPVKTETVNAVSAARATLGMEAYIIELDEPIRMKAWRTERGAQGSTSGLNSAVSQLRKHRFDALAVATQIETETELSLSYFQSGGVNPWGGVEAIVSSFLSKALTVPVAHAPVENDDALKYFNEIVDPRMAAEMTSLAFLHCVLKGLHRAPRLVYSGGLSADDIDVLVTASGCYGEPHIAMQKLEKPIVVVKENQTIGLETVNRAIEAENYLEAAGVLLCIKQGISLASVHRPLAETRVYKAATPHLLQQGEGDDGHNTTV